MSELRSSGLPLRCVVLIPRQPVAPPQHQLPAPAASTHLCDEVVAAQAPDVEGHLKANDQHPLALKLASAVAQRAMRVVELQGRGRWWRASGMALLGSIRSTRGQGGARHSRRGARHSRRSAKSCTALHCAHLVETALAGVPAWRVVKVVRLRSRVQGKVFSAGDKAGVSQRRR